MTDSSFEMDAKYWEEADNANRIDNGVGGTLEWQKAGIISIDW